MNFIAENRKKKSKNSKLAKQTTTTKIVEKTRLSRDYQESEKEVQQLLENVKLSLQHENNESKEDENLDSQSVDFFCNDCQTFTQTQTENEEPTSIDNENASENEDSSKELEFESVKSDDTVKATHSTSTRSENQYQTASTFIQIESSNLNNCMKLLPATVFETDSSLLFKPTSELHHSVRLGTSGEKCILNNNTMRMLNRYHEQAKITNGESLKMTAKALEETNKLNETKNVDPFLYRTFSLHEFHPIFCNAADAAIEIPTRRFVKIFLKEFRFTRHPQLCEEHTIANELEDLYEEYSQRKVKQIERQLEAERRIVNVMLKNADSTSTSGTAATKTNLRKLQEALFRVKEIRTRLYAEHGRVKSLLRQILDKWLQLKKLRQGQEFQCTRFKLRINIENVSSLSIDNARQDWEKRFQNDLSEIYREELEIYYRSKRLYKAGNDAVITKPKKPRLSRLSTELKEKYAEIFFMPEEPKIEIQKIQVSDEEFYENTAKLTNNVNQYRRLGSFFFKIYLDQEFVVESRNYRMEPDFSLRIHEAFGVFLDRQLPKQVKIVCYEKTRVSASHKISSIIVPLPISLKTNEAHTDDDFPMEKTKFSSEKQPVEGYLRIGIKCEVQSTPNDHLLKIPKSLKENIKSLDHNIIESDVETSSLTTDTCTFEESSLQFCSIDDLKSNARFKLLQSRYQKQDDLTRNLRFIPALEHELEIDCESKEMTVIETGDWIEPIDLHKFRGKKYLRNLYDAITNQCSRLEKMERSDELLIGDDPGWSVLFDAFKNIFHQNRVLNHRNTVLKTKDSSVLQFDGSIQLALNVVRATGIPVRHQNTPAEDLTSDTFMSQNIKYTNIRPYITLSYKDKFCRTITAEGSNPTWNEHLVLKLSGSLADFREDIKISLFDEIIQSQVNDDLSTVRSMDIYQRVQANWLGDYRIPIGTVLQHQKIEGNVELNTPKVLPGYKRQQISTNFDTQIIVEFKESVQLYFYLSVEPDFELPRINTKTLECTELKEVRQNLYQWSLLVRDIKLNHFIEPLVCTEDGKRVCLTRLLEPVPLPFENNESAVDNVCRYVSLLSTMKQFDACIGFHGVWLSNQTLLDTTWGSPKDLGVLLCNFLLALGKKCWLVLGLGNTFGESTFVLVVNDDGTLHFMEPLSGRKYGVKDSLCPIKKIFYIISQDNIFCNIQTESRVTMMNLNFNDTSCWLPAFSKRNPAPLGGVQKLNYNYHAPLSTIELSKNIERKIMKKIRSWRTMRKTVWNRAFQPRLHSVLIELEAKSILASNNSNEDTTNYAEEIAAEFPTFKIYGFTLNFSYKNLSSVSEHIKSTAIHLNSDPNVEFSLAVHTNSYPNDVVSVWIFLITLIPHFNFDSNK